MPSRYTPPGGGGAVAISPQDNAILFTLQTEGVAISANMNGANYMDLNGNSNASSLTFTGFMSIGSWAQLSNFACPINFGIIFDDGNATLVLNNVSIDGGSFAPPTGATTLNLLTTSNIGTLDLTDTVPTVIDASGVTSIAVVNLATLTPTWTVTWNFAGNPVGSAFFDNLYAQQANFSGGSINLGTTLYDNTQPVTVTSVANPGSGYSNGFARAEGGSGSGAYMNLTTAAGLITGGTIDPSRPGTGYTDADVLNFPDAGDGTGALFIRCGNAQIDAFANATGCAVTFAHV